VTLNMNAVVGRKDIVFLTLDTLRYDVAEACFRNGETPHLGRIFPGGWEERHSPGSFTYAAHHAFFAGFFPTPVTAPWPERLFAVEFPGSATTGPGTCVFRTPDIVSGLHSHGYRTICIGGVGFFNQLSPLSCVLPSLFEEAHWSPEFGVTQRDSTEIQFALAAQRLGEIPTDRRVFLFVNVSAIHQPNWFYLEGGQQDSLASHAAALRYVDSKLPVLIEAIRARGGAFLVVCSDHGTLYGEDGFVGHRVGHPSVWTVPYAETLLEEI